jgi:aminoglycoside phosphotransferase (APT) family kinase protein
VGEQAPTEAGAPVAGLDDAALAWIGDLFQGSVLSVERSLSRREGWYVDVEDGTGRSVPLFVRVARPGDTLNDPATLAREADLAGVLAQHGITVARMFGRNEDLHLAVYERLAGRSDITEVGAAEQQAIHANFLEILGAVHGLDVDSLGLPFDRPATAHDAALAGLDVLEANHAAAHADPRSSARPSPLVAYGLRWLRDHAPRGALRLSLVHGDAGTPNFLYDGERVTGVIDWEWARFGDPMEDLGNAALHAVFHPSGDWPELLAHYERSSGIEVDVDRVRYYRAHLAVRSVVALGTATARWDAHDPVALNLCYRTISERITCECIAEVMGITLERVPLELPDDPAPSLYAAVAESLRQHVMPAVAGRFAQGRAAEARLLVLALEREHRGRPELNEIERRELAGVLGSTPHDVESGWDAVMAKVAEGEPDADGTILRLLFNRAWREEQLLAPVVSLFPGIELRPLS